jgi:23S rRNA (uridine2552-2'-O)-methyltransferase
MARSRRGRRRPDAYGKRARREGQPARSVYKLEEIDRRVGLLRRGHRVLDLGAAPGSWAAYAADKVGREGSVVAIDLAPLRTALPQNAKVIEADVRSLDPGELGRFDVVLSDMAPSTSGHRSLDQARSFELYSRALAIAEAVLDPGGHFAGKLFQGPDFEQARTDTARAFGKVKIVRPRATRSESYETFLVGLRRR